ncbi:Glucuronide transport protein YihO [Enterobacter hormaechei]|nr:Glucuronide transport protein YihO [Enterobacter hormaechei]
MTHNTDPLTLKLSLREKCAYGMGDFGSNLMLCIGTLYLLKFYTDELGMPAFYGGIIFFGRQVLYRVHRHADRGAAGFPA